MGPTDRNRFASCLLAASELYGKPVGEAVAGVWWDTLARFDIAAVESAFRRHFANPDSGQFMPKPADIVRMVEGTTVDASQVAWSKVDKAVRSIGPYSSVAFDDPIVHRVLTDMGGWIALGTRTDDEWPFIANEFRTRYQGYRSRGETPEYPPTLVGIAEADNARRNLKAQPELALIGDSTRAKEVMQGGTGRLAVGLTRIADATAAAVKLIVHEGGRQ